MKKESKASKIAGGFNDSLDIDKLASMASQMSTPSVSKPPKAVVATAATLVEAKKDRRFTIILPHDLYMKMVMKTKSDGMSFTKYIHQLMTDDLV